MTLRAALEKPILERRHSGADTTATRVRLGATTLADLLAPDGVDRRASHCIQVGDSYVTTLELRGFPPMLDLAWLSDPSLDLDAPGITIHQRIEPMPDARADESPDDFATRWQQAFLGSLRRYLSGEPENLRLSGGIWRHLVPLRD